MAGMICPSSNKEENYEGIFYSFFFGFSRKFEFVSLRKPDKSTDSLILDLAKNKDRCEEYNVFIIA